MPDSSAADPLPHSAPTISAAPALPGNRHSWIGRAAGAFNAIYLFGFLLLILLLLWWGERHWLVSLLLFAPAYALLLPLLILTPFCLIVRPRLVLWHLLCAAIVYFGYMEYSWSFRPSRYSDALKVVTFNSGQADRRQFQSFVDSEKPDLIMLQDARYRGADYTRMWPDRHVAGRGEFVVISRYPVQHAELVDKPTWDGQPVAARFEVVRENKPFIVYNVHLPTPRSQLHRFLSARVVKDLFGDEERGKAFATYREWVDARIKLARDLAEVFASEKQPFIACGDFNTPDRGYIHRILSRGMVDAHAQAGRGWGLTFPGGISGLAARHGPWLRIDYAYAGRGWEPVFCHTDSGSRSQHRAVAAHFVPLL
jgi:endonuclease/exonuclease/phosphatase (EEP) superfamily protein YafD